MITAETIERILHFDSGGLPVVSIYVTVPTDLGDRRSLRSQASNLLHRIRPLGEDREIEHEARLSVREDIERIEAAIKGESWSPGTAVIFSCSRGGLYEEIALPRAVHDRIVVDAAPWVRETVAVLDEYHRCCVVMVDSKTARVWELYQDELREVGQLEDESLRKSDFAGWQGFSEHGVRNKADELARRHFRRVATLVDKLFRRERLELLAIGGHEHEVPRFIEALPRALRTRVAGTFAVDPHTVTAKTIRDHAGAIVERCERDEEQRWVERVLDAEAAGGLAAVGVDDCLWAGSVSAVEALLVQDDTVVPGVVCGESRWLAREGASCPLCGKPPRPTADVMDELVQFVIEDGGSIEHVYADTALAQHALAASLRFPLPAPPQ